MAAFFGFSRTILTARKQDQKLYEQATMETANLLESGTRLATRALAWGTFYAFLGTGTVCYGIWKLSGAKNVSKMCVLNSYVATKAIVSVHSLQMEEFRLKMGGVLPKLSKDTQEGRTDFDGLNDLMSYLDTHKKSQ